MLVSTLLSCAALIEAAMPAGFREDDEVCAAGTYVARYSRGVAVAVVTVDARAGAPRITICVACGHDLSELYRGCDAAAAGRSLGAVH